jgi:hypothetical protein
VCAHAHEPLSLNKRARKQDVSVQQQLGLAVLAAEKGVLLLLNVVVSALVAVLAPLLHSSVSVLARLLCWLVCEVLAWQLAVSSLSVLVTGRGKCHPILVAKEETICFLIRKRS